MIVRLARQIFGINQDEVGFVFTMGFMLFLNAIALQIANVVSISGFVHELGTNAIVILWVVEMIIIIVTTGVHTLLVDRYDRKRLLRGISLFFAGSYFLLLLMFVFGLPEWLNYSGLSLLVDQQLYFFPIIFWILANDVTHPSRAVKMFPVIASFGIIGDVAGLGISAAAPEVLHTLSMSESTLLVLVVGAFVGVFLLGLRLSTVEVRMVQRQHETVRETLSEGIGFVSDVPAFRYLMLSMFAIAAIMTVIEYHFLSLGEAQYDELGSFQTFYSLIFLAQTLVAVVVQAFLTSRVITRLNLKNTFFIMPLTALLCISALIGFPGIVSATTGYLVAKLVLNGIDDTARKSLQSFVPEERRGRVSMFMDSYLYAAGVILGAVIIGLTIIIAPQLGGIPSTLAYLFIGFIFAFLSIAWITQMRRSYDSSMFNWRLKRRQRVSSVLDKL